MTTTPTGDPGPEAPKPRSKAATASLYLAVGALLAAAVLGGYFIIVGDQANVAGRAWLTLLLVALFAGAAVLDAHLADGPNRWYLAASTIVNVLIVAAGLIKLWNGWGQPENTDDPFVWTLQGLRVVLVVILMRLALLFTQLYGLAFVTRARSAVGRLMGVLTIALVWVLALILVVPSVFPEPGFEWPDWWWRLAGAAALVAVVTTVIPLIVRAFEPKAPKPPRPVVQPPVYYGAPYGAPYGPGVPMQQGMPVQPGVPMQYPGVPGAPGGPVPPPVQQPAPPVAPAAPQPAEPPVAPPGPGTPPPPQ